MTDTTTAVKNFKGGGKRIPMTVSPDAKNQKHLMTALSKLYTRPSEAIFRETVTNAYDSHKRARQEAPIEVTYSFVSRSRPINFQQVFNSQVSLHVLLTVQDYGVGMSADDVENVYSQYGNSTKQNDHVEAGFFGLGAKAGISLAEEVFIRAVKDGVYTEAKMFTDKFESSFIDIIETGPCAEPDGVKVSLEFETSENISDFFKNFFVTWKPGTVLLNGKQPYSLWDNDSYEALTAVNGEVTGWMLMKKSSADEQRLPSGAYTDCLHVAVGPVVYSISFNEASKFLSFSHDTFKMLSKTFLVLPVGSVHLTAPREGFMWTDETVETLKEAYTDFIELADNFYRHHAESLTEAEAVKFFAEHEQRIVMVRTLIERGLLSVEDTAEVFSKNVNGNVDVLWHGENLNEKIVFPSVKAYEYSTYSSGASQFYTNTYDKYGAAKNHYVFSGGAQMFKEVWFTRNIKDFIASHGEDDKVKRELTIFFMDSQPTGRWVDYWARPITKEEFVATAKAHAGDKKTPRPVSYPVYDPNTKSLEYVPVKSIDDDALYLGNMEGLLYGGVTNSVVESVKKVKTYPSDKLKAMLNGNSWFLLDQTLQFLGLSQRQIVLLHDRKPSALKKAKPSTESLSRILYNYFQNLPERQQKFVVMQAFGLHYQLKKDYSVFVKNSRKLSYYSGMIENDFILDMVTFFSEQDLGRLSFFKLLASNVFFWAKSDDYDVTFDIFFTPSNNLYCVAPFMMSHVWNPDHMVKYVNTVEEIPGSSISEDIFSFAKFIGTKSAPLRWGDFMYDKDKELES